MTVTVMSLGEIELADTFLQAGQIIDEFKDDTYILLLVFLFIMPIVLMNLLVSRLSMTSLVISSGISELYMGN